MNGHGQRYFVRGALQCLTCSAIIYVTRVGDLEPVFMAQCLGCGNQPGGGERPLGIPTIRCRVVQTAAKLVLEPIFEADLENSAYGYRPRRDATGAVKEVHRLICRGYTDVVDADLSKYFDSIPRLRENPETPLAKRRDPDSTERMIRPGFLDIELRQNLIELARDGLAAHRLARRANALVLLDDGMSCEAIAKVLLLDDDTIRTWYRLYEEDGIEGLTNFSYGGSACQLSGEQQEKLKAWVATALPRTTRQVGAWIENEFGVVYEGRSGLIALLHRLGLEYHKPNVIPRKLDEEKQKAFIEGYEKLLNSLGDDEAVLFADAVHPTHAARPVGCWAPSREKLAIEQTSGRQRINIHGAIDLETGQTRMIEALTIDAASTIRLLQSIEALYPMLALIHVFLDNARYHHAKLVQEWLALPGRRIKLHFIPTYCPHLNPIERLCGLMHRNVTHNKCYATCAQFADATLSFLREKVPGNCADLCDSVTDNFRVINPKDFRVMT